MATAAAGYFAAYGAAVLGVVALFAPTGRLALDLLAGAALMGLLTCVLLVVDAIARRHQAPPLPAALA